MRSLLGCYRVRAPSQGQCGTKDAPSLWERNALCFNSCNSLHAEGFWSVAELVKCIDGETGVRGQNLPKITLQFVAKLKQKGKYLAFWFSTVKAHAASLLWTSRAQQPEKIKLHKVQPHIRQESFYITVSKQILPERFEDRERTTQRNTSLRK